MLNSSITPAEAAAELLRRREARRALIPFTKYTFPQYIAEPAHYLIGDTLDKVVAGEVDRLMIFAPPQHGKCLVAGSPVLLESGELSPIECIRPSSVVISLEKCYNIDKRRVLNTFDNGVKPVIKITLNSGRFITVTKNHPLLTVRGWVEAGKLSVGDSIGALNNVPIPNGEPLPFGYAALMGYITGDGSYGKGDPKITIAEKDVVFHIEKIAGVHKWELRRYSGRYEYGLSRQKKYRIARKKVKGNRCAGGVVKLKPEDIFPILERIDKGESYVSIAKSYSVSRKAISAIRNGNTWRRRVTKVDYVRGWATDIDPKNELKKYMTPAKSIDKRVPPCIFKANENDLCSFLAAYFNADGSVNSVGHGSAEYYSTSEYLLRDVQHLLARLGVYSILRPKKGRYKNKTHHSWRLIISGADLIQMANALPVLGERGEKLRDVAANISKTPHHPLHKSIPPGWKSHMKQTAHWYRKHHSIRIDKNYTHGTARHLVSQIAEIEDNDELRKLCSPSIIWERIVSIEDAGEQQTYDIEVEETHNFITDAIITHNSELISVRLPAFWLANRPDDPVILSSYGASLAEDKGRQARDLVESDAYRRLFPDVATYRSSRAVQMWRLQNRRGYMLSVGVGGPVTGRGAMLGIIDDPFENWEQAQSETHRNKVWDWYRATFRTRIWEGGAIVLIMTRWHEDDLAGRLLAEQKDNWYVLRLPAMAETQKDRDTNNRYLGLPIGEADPLGRQAGDPLCPIRYSRTALAELKFDVGSMAWSAEYQGVPRPLEGSFFKRDWFKAVNTIPEGDIVYRVRYWDNAATEDGGAYTCGTLLAQANDGYYYVEDVVRGQWSSRQRNDTILQTAQTDAATYGNTVHIWFEQEGGSSGKDASAAILSMLSGFPARADKVSGSKLVRAQPFAAKAEAKLVRILAAGWNRDWLDEITGFPNGKYKDQVDSVSGAYNKMPHHVVGQLMY